ncbi:MAG: InlB B-repeat-containing protein, partial [Treponema sp.]|nr:InlB B-repeat-containing protein [Treponema sp.]
MKGISFLRHKLACTLMTALLLVSACMLTACSDDDGPSGTPKVTVTYTTELGTPPVEIKLAKGKELTSTELPDLSFNGYEFSGWYIISTEEGVEDIKVEPGYKLTGNITLTAKWIKLSYFVTYISEQGNYSKSVTVEENTVIDASYLAAPNLTIEGYEFTGWYIGD